MRDLNEIRCFVKAVELGSLTAAAKALSMPTSSVSRKIQSLEEGVGLTLMTRTTRALNLTEAGRQFFERSSLALKEVDSAVLELDGSRHAVEGTLRVTAPETFAVGPLNDLIASFMKAYPKVRIELHLTNDMVDLIAGGYDFAIRGGKLEDSTLTSRTLYRQDAVLVASPEYLKEHGTPNSLAELEKHDCIGFVIDGVEMKVPLKGPGGRKAFLPNGRLVVNSALTMKEAAIRGVGIALLPIQLVKDDLEEKSLRVVCREWRYHEVLFHLVYPRHRFLSTKMRAFIEYTIRNFSP